MSTKENYTEQLRNLLVNIEGNDFYALDYIYESDLLDKSFGFDDEYDIRDYIYETLTDKGAFQVEIIYYYQAHKYLCENQAIDDAIEIATELGITIDYLTSERLASLHASKKAEEEFLDLEMEIFENIYNLLEEYNIELTNA